MVLIVPLWNWNSDYMPFWTAQACSNRTFMELKCGFIVDVLVISNVLIVPLWNWNTTKQTNAPDSVPVLIVPLWNWNITGNTKNWVFPRSNRTFMELKCRLFDDDETFQPGSNRTFMELKWVGNGEGTDGAESSNRTFMELKLASSWERCFACSF